jgi:hypothetical protein
MSENKKEPDFTQSEIRLLSSFQQKFLPVYSGADLCHTQLPKDDKFRSFHKGIENGSLEQRRP